MSGSKMTRRDFLKVSGAVALASLGSRYFLKGVAKASPSGQVKRVRSTCSPNCTGACAYHAEVVDGRIRTLIQAADYPEEDYNPRGCPKGLSMLNLIYGPEAAKRPLIRVGKRGEGKFKAVSWKEALDYVADKLIEIMKKYGPDSVSVSVQVPGTGYVNKGALIRLASMFGWRAIHGYSMNGDLPTFWAPTFGVQTEEHESLEWTNARLILIFGSNILITRVPDAKFLLLAQERGAKIVVIDPSYNPTAQIADVWVPINPSCDVALCLGIAHEMIQRKLYDEKFLKTFTDMPVLVRMDTKKRLRASEIGLTLEKEIPPYREVFVIYDRNKQGFAPLDPTTLNPAELGTDPEIDFEGEVEIEGNKVQVKSIFRIIKERVLAEYSPEKAAEIIQVPGKSKEFYVKIIKQLAEEIGTRHPVLMIYGASNYQWYHGDLKGRAISLISAFSGDIGKPGGGITTYAGQFKIRWPLGKWWIFPKDKGGAGLKWLTYLLWVNKWYRNSAEYKKYREKHPFPKKGVVKAIIYGWHNPLDQHNLAERMKEFFADESSPEYMDLIVAVDFQMSTSAAWSDVLLPAASWYEKYELTATVLHPYVQLQQPAIKPMYEKMPEIWIFKEIAKRLVAKWDNPKLKENIAFYYWNEDAFRKEEEAYKNGSWNLDLAREIAEQVSLEVIDKPLLKLPAKKCRLVQGVTLDKLLKGPVRLNLPAPGKRQIPFWEQINKFVPFPPPSYPIPLPKTARFVKTGRIEFYREEQYYLDFDETIPIHKPPYEESYYRHDSSYKTKYPYGYITTNSLYRIHSTHSNNITMLELQGYKPRIFINPVLAKKLGIKNGDYIEAYSMRGKVRGYALLDPGLHPNLVAFWQGWWRRYLKETSYNSVIFPVVKSSTVVHFAPGTWEPSTSWNEAICNIRKV